MHTLYRHTLYRLANGHLMSQTSREDCSLNARKKRKRSEVEPHGGGCGEANEASPTQSPPPALSSLPFCAGFQFSLYSIRAFNDRIKGGGNGTI